MRVAAYHEWGVLREAVVGTSPRHAFVLPRWSAEVASWAGPEFAALCRRHGGRRLVDVAPDLALRMERQADGFAARLEGYGVRVHRAASREPEGASSLFPRDLAIVAGKHLIEAAMRSPVRAEEARCVRDLLASLAAPDDPASIPGPVKTGHAGDGIFLEGGDVLLNGDEIYVGDSGCATNGAGISRLRELLGSSWRVHRIRLARRAFHLDCALGLLRPGLGLVCRERILEEEPLPGALKDFELLAVTPDEADRLGTNVCVIDDKTLLMDSGCDRVARLLRERGQTVETLPFDGPILRGGGPRCCHLALRRDSRP